MTIIPTGQAMVHAMGSALAAMCGAGRSSGPESGGSSSGRFDSAFGCAFTGVRPVVRHPRRCLLAALFVLPMLFAPATAAAAEPKATFGAAAHNKAEDNSAGDLSVVVSTNSAVSADLAVSYTLGGTATPGTDYTISSGADYAARTGTFTIPSGTKAGIFVEAFTITAISDALEDGGETIVVTITDGAGYDPGTTDTTTITLFENTGDAAFAVSGAPVMGETLTVVQTVDDPDGNGTVQQYQWLRKSPDAQAWIRILGATQRDYAAPAIHVGQELLVAVTYVDDLGVTRTVHTPPIGPVVEYYTVSFSEAKYSAKEGIPVHAWVHISPVRASATHVPISTTAITATGGGVDYQDYGATVTIPAGWNRFPLSVNTVIDKVLDEGETFRLDIDGSSLPDGVKVGTHGSAVVTLLDPVLAITGGDAVDEGQPAVFTLNMDYGPGGTWPYIDVRVAVPWGGRVMSRTVRRDAQETVLSFTATGDDLNVSGDWHYCAWVLPVTGYKTGDSGKPPKPSGKTYDGNPANCPSGATVLVRDDDDDPSEAEAPRVTSIERQFPTSAKAITPPYLRWRVTFSEEVGNVDKGDFQLTGTTASLSVQQARNYYGKPIDGTWNGEKWVADGTSTTWEATARGGNLLDGKGTVSLSFADDQNIQDLDGNALADTTPTGTNDNHFVLNDPDAPAAEPAASFASATSSSAEDAGTHKVMLNLAPAPSTGLTLSYTVDGTATAGSGKDFTIQDAGTLTVAAGATTAALPVGLHDDASVEDDETVVLTLTDGTGYTLGGTTAHTFTIADNDGSAGTPGVTVSTDALDLAEGGTAGSYTVVLAAEPTANVTVTATSGDAAKVKLHKQGGSPGASTTLTFTPTTWNQIQTITVTPEQDDDADDESVTVAHAVSQTGGYDGVTVASVTVAVDDDETPTACVSDALLADVQGYASETQHGSDHVERWRRVLAAFGESNSYSNNPMAASEAQTYADRWTRGRWVPVVTALECLEGAPPPPALPAVSISAGAGITEGGDAVFTVSASPAPPADLTVSLAVADDANSDFLAQSDEGTRTVTIAGGQTSATLTVTTQDDSADETDGSVTATVSDGTGYTVGSPSTATVAVSDDDPAPTPVVGIAAGSAITEGGTARFTLTATPAPLGTLTVNVNVVDSGAFASSGESGAKTVTIDTTGSATLDVATDNDNTDEPDGTLGATIATGQGYTPSGTHGSASIAVSDDDASTACVSDALLADVDNRIQTAGSTAGVERWTRVKNALTGEGNAITLAEVREIRDRRAQNGWSTAQWDPVIEALECLEGTTTPTVPQITVQGGSAVTEGGDAVFTVGASPAPTASLAVSLTVADDANSDFLAQSDEGTRTVTIASGQTSATLTLTTQDDSTDEADGSVTATVSTGTGYTVGSPSAATVAVADDDPTPQGTPVVSIAAGADLTEGGDATFTFTASPVPTVPITVDVAVAQSGDFATGGQTGARTVTIASSGTATLTVATDDDSTNEADGSITATVQTGTGYTAHATQNAATVAVDDDDVPVVRVAGGAGVTEGASASFTVTASPPPAAPLDVTLAIGQSGDFAASGETGTRTVTVGTGGTATLTVATDDDTTDEANGSVTATVQTGTGYTVAASPNHAATVAVSDDDGASSGPTLSIADASFNENERYGYFTVTLSEATDRDVRFVYATRDSTPVSATANEDYVAFPRAWRIGGRVKAGETQTRFHVLIRNDNHDEGPETFEVEISDAFVWRSGKVALTITDSVAVGTIVNSDPMPAAWLARFGRTAAEAALDGIAGRIAAPRSAGVQGTLAGQALTFGGAGPDGSGSGASGAASHTAALADTGFPGTGLRTGSGAYRLVSSETAGRPKWGAPAFGTTAERFAGPGWEADPYGPGAARTLTLRDALLGSHFTATGAEDASGGSLALWGRAAHSTFDGREGTFSLDGETTTAMLGADYARERWLLGLALMQSEGDGGYADRGTGTQRCADAGDDMDLDMMESLCDGAVREGDGDVEASLTAAMPYAALEASERLKLWGAFGHGSGEVTLKPRTGGVLESDITWTMAAAGTRSALLTSPGEDAGLSLALVSDALWARTRSDRTNELAASDSDVTRLRLGLEGRWTHPFEGGGHFTPKLEAGMRHDGGDAETGFGVEVGGGLAWSAPALGLNLDLSGRTLLAHGDDDLKDRGFAAALTFDPDPASERGPSFSFGRSFGGQATGGVDALFTPDPLEERGSTTSEQRWTAEAAWGFAAFGGRVTGSPHAGVGLSTGTRDYTLGYRVVPARDTPALDVSFGVAATRSEREDAQANHTIGVEIGARW